MGKEEDNLEKAKLQFTRILSCLRVCGKTCDEEKVKKLDNPQLHGAVQDVKEIVCEMDEQLEILLVEMEKEEPRPTTAK